MSYEQHFKNAMSLTAGKTFNLNGKTIEVPKGGQWQVSAETQDIANAMEKQRQQDLAMGEQAYYARGAEEGDPFAKKALGLLNQHLSR